MDTTLTRADKNNGNLTDHISIGVLTKTVSRSAVDEVLAQTGRREQRSRSLPAHVVVYFVIALALFCDGYAEVLTKLVHGLRYARVWSKAWTVPTTGALSQARRRLGAEPLRQLYETTAAPLADPTTPGAWLGQWRLTAIDGVMLDLADSDANRAEFPKPEGGTRRPFPQLRAVGLAECGTHAILTAAVGNIHTGERELACQLLDSVQHDMLVIADRGFYSFDMWRAWLATGAALLWRVWSTVKLEPITVFPDGSYLAEIATKHARSSKTRIPLDAVDDPKLATHITVRVIEYQVTGHTDTGGHTETIRLITTITNPEEASAVDLAAAYHQRWELETTFGEIQVRLLGNNGLRSKSPDMVHQEFWGVLIAHYAIRAFIVEAADTVDIDPDRLSFTRTVNIIRRQVTDPAVFSPQSTETKPRPGNR